MNLSPQMEDYLEAIGDLSTEHGLTRVRDLARRLGVTNPSVVGAIRTLKQHSLVDQERYGFVRLTEEGQKRADVITGRHQALSRFLQEVLGLDEPTASKDACRIEHVVSPETMKRLRAAAAFLGGDVHSDLHWKEEFLRFYATWTETFP
jgi:DtxR family transcriptional regulator, Mn-dependent transcriptional regulator